MKPRILLVNPISSYSVLNHFNEQLEEAYIKMGFTVDKLTLRADDFVDCFFEHINSKQVVAIITFNGILLEFLYDCKDTIEALKIPVYTILVDNPIYHRQRLSNLVKNVIISCVDTAHIPFLEDILKIKNPLHFLPHGAIKLKDEQPKPISERKNDILVALSYLDSNKCLEEINLAPKPLIPLLYSAIEMHLLNPNLDQTEVTKHVFNNYNIPNHYLYAPQWWDWYTRVNLFVRGERRVNFVKSLEQLNSTISVKLYGTGWENSEIDTTKINYLGPANFKTIYNEMQDSKLVVSTYTNFKNGLHERILTTMSTGAVNLVDKDEACKNFFTENKHYITYDYENLDIAILHKKLNDTIKLQEIANETLTLISENHLWQHRALDIIDHINLQLSFA